MVLFHKKYCPFCAGGVTPCTYCMHLYCMYICIQYMYTRMHLQRTGGTYSNILHSIYGYNNCKLHGEQNLLVVAVRENIKQGK